MKKSIFVCFTLILCTFLSFGQNDIFHSWDGTGISPNSSFRVLNIFANIIFDVDSTMDPVNTSDTCWPRITNPAKAGINVSGTIPSYLLNLEFMDTAYACGQTKGCITRIFGESSFDSLQIIGDFVVVNLLQSRMIERFGTGNIYSFVNILQLCSEMINETGGLSTLFGHNRRMDYVCKGTDFYYTIFCVRNTSAALGGKNVGNGNASVNAVPIKVDGQEIRLSGKGASQCVGSSDIASNPTSVITHEIAHSLFGSNNFHIGGGNHRGSTETMPFLPLQGGYALLGGGNSGLVSCNGYERWRMHWKHPDVPANTYIYARNVSNNGYLNSDVQKEDGEKWFVLRDFVTYGDAIRIKLPYKDSSITPNQYIWLEFHDVGHNDKLDFLQYSNTSCLHPGAPGIYAYYQIGRDVLESSVRNQVWDTDNRDNLRVISNEGYWDYTRHLMPRDTNFVCTQWHWVSDYFVPEFPNAFCGYQDQEKFIVPKAYDTDLGNTVDSVFEDGLFSHTENVIREYTMWNKISSDGDTVRNSISFIGDSRDAFSAHRKINMGTNPSTCNAKTYYTGNLGKARLTFNSNTLSNNTTTYLTGLSIEMIPLSNDTSWLVKIRWDDYDITDDARWTGKIVLKGAEQVNLTRGYSITLAQNRTPAQQYRNSESGYFAEPTQLTCEAGSIFTQQPQSSVILTEKSRFTLDSGATYHLGDSAQILVQSGSQFYIRWGADFHGGISSTIIVDSLGTLSVEDTAKMRRNTRIIVRPGGKLIVNGGTLTSACEGEMWQGIIVEGHNDIRQAALAQGSVILNNATIENAWTAISTRGADTNAIYEHTGGIVQATNTLFSNNRRSVEFLSYENHTTTHQVTDNASYFTRCTFTVDDDNLFVAQGRNFQNHVTMWQVRGVKFNGCSFRNEMSGTASKGKAIYTIEAGYNAKRVCPTISSIDPCVCENHGTDTVTRCSFVGFDTAVHTSSTLGNYDITLDNCDFAQNLKGGLLSVADNDRISFCDFNLDHPSSVVSGIVLQNSTGYTIEGNSFHRTSTKQAGTGICFDNSGSADNVARLNDFTKLQYGCRALNSNANNKVRVPTGLQFFCNSFSRNQYDISVSTNASIRRIQGSATAGADNDFVNTRANSLTIPSTHDPVTYYRSSGGNHQPIGSSSYYTVLNATTNSCASTICGIHIDNPIVHGLNGGALPQYQSMAEHLGHLQEQYENIQDLESEEAVALQSEMSDLSAAMSELARTEIRGIISDSVPDLALLKDWYKAINTPLTHYLMAETQSTEGLWDKARATLEDIPVRFELDDSEKDEYTQYGSLQSLREAVSGNWYKLSDSQIAEMQQVAESGNGRAARMAKEILCFFHHICYEEAVDYDEAERSPIGTRALQQTGSSVSADGEVRVYPNPANTTLTVAAASEMRELSVYDLTGRCVQRQSAAGTYIELNISALHSGTYILKVATEQGEEQIRFVKE